MTIVTTKHLREARICPRGARAWFKQHGFDWADFLANGISDDQLEATGDSLIMGAIEAARRHE